MQILEGILGEMPVKIPGGNSDRIAEENPEKIPSGISEGMPRETPEGTTRKVHRVVPEIIL